MSLIPTSYFDGHLFVVGLLIGFLLYAVRKIDYYSYKFLSGPRRIHVFLGKRDFLAYWSTRPNVSRREVFFLYTLWVLRCLDRYFPLVDCERQAAKAQYFHDYGRYSGMRAFAFRRFNPEAWPVLLVRHFFAAARSFFVSFFSMLTALLAPLFLKLNKVVDQFQK